MKHIILTFLLITAIRSTVQAQSGTNYIQEFRLLKTQYEDQQAKLKAQYGEALKRLYNKVEKNPANGQAKQDVKAEMTKLGIKSDDDWYSGIWDVTLQMGRPLGKGFQIDDNSVSFYSLQRNAPIKGSSTGDIGNQFKRTDKAIYAIISEKLYIFSKHSPNRLKIRYYHSGKEDDKVEEWMGTFVKAQ